MIATPSLIQSLSSALFDEATQAADAGDRYAWEYTWGAYVIADQLNVGDEVPASLVGWVEAFRLA